MRSDMRKKATDPEAYQWPDVVDEVKSLLRFAQASAWDEGYLSGARDGFTGIGIDSTENPYRSAS